jgi:hypothetical protein
VCASGSCCDRGSNEEVPPADRPVYESTIIMKDAMPYGPTLPSVLSDTGNYIPSITTCADKHQSKDTGRQLCIVVGLHVLHICCSVSLPYPLSPRGRLYIHKTDFHPFLGTFGRSPSLKASEPHTTIRSGCAGVFELNVQANCGYTRVERPGF